MCLNVERLVDSYSHSRIYYTYRIFLQLALLLNTRRETLRLCDLGGRIRSREKVRSEMTLVLKWIEEIANQYMVNFQMNSLIAYYCVQFSQGFGTGLV